MICSSYEMRSSLPGACNKPTNTSSKFKTLFPHILLMHWVTTKKSPLY